MKKIYVIGAGQLGSRHLQALKSVPFPLAISVIDPSADALGIARQRYEEIAPGQYNQEVQYIQHIPSADGPIDLAIIATNANVRKEVISQLMQKNRVEYLILEKLLFQRRPDYQEVSNLLTRTGTRAWVNCPMRFMSFYRAAKQEFANDKIFYQVSGSQYGLVTNAIHYLDHIAYLTGILDFEVETALLDFPPIPSKRKGFGELNGTLTARYADGSLGVITCYPEGNAPVQVQIQSRNVRMVVRETEGKAWVARANENWQWSEADVRIPYQSEMTADVVEDILTTGTCKLTPYPDSVKIHLNMLDPLLAFLNDRATERANLYPFT